MLKWADATGNNLNDPFLLFSNHQYMCSCQLSVAQTCFAKVNKMQIYYKSSGIYFHDMVNALVNKKTTELQAHAGTD